MVKEKNVKKPAVILLVVFSFFWFSSLNVANAILLVDSGPAALGGPSIFATDPEFGGIPQFLAQQFTR
jgi:hypothetical protein